jgi:hypothetical protein
MPEHIKRELPPKRGEHLIRHEDALRVSAFDRIARGIIRDAPGKNYQKERGHRAIRTANLLNDFFERRHFEGKACLELGPGHYNFAMLARYLGATVICVERDPVHAALGRHLGFEVIEKDIFQIGLEELLPVDGIWLKNVQYRGGYTREKQAVFLKKLGGLMKREAWGWCVLRNRIAQDHNGTLPGAIPELLTQRAVFEAAGWTAVEIVEEDRKRYALNVRGAPWIFTHNL